MSQLANNEDNVTFACNAIAFPAPSYNWITPIANSAFDTNTITISVEYDDYGNFTCMAISNGTVATSQPALLTGTSCDVCSIVNYTHTHT